MSASPLICAAQVMLNYLIPLVAEQISLAWGFKDELQRLSDKLELIQALLHDAENRGGGGGGVIIRLETMRLWLKKLNSVASLADDVLDEFKFEALRRKFELQNRFNNNKVRNLFSLSNPLPFRLKMVHKVKHINLLFDNLCKEANDVGLRPADQILNAASITSAVEPRESNFRLTHPFVDDSQVVGRDGDVSTVIDMLLGSSDNTVDDLSVIAIVGMGGMDYNIQKDKLIQLWMAQGYLQPSSGCNLEMEDVDIELDVYNNITGCKMHDLVHDLALDVSQGNCLALTSIASEQKYHPEDKGRKIEELGSLSKLRELSNCTRCEQIPPLGHLPHLEVIKMSGLSNLKRIGPEFYGCDSVVNHDHDNDGIISGSCSGAATTAAAAKALAVVFPALRELHLVDMPNIEEWSGLGVSSLLSDTTILTSLQNLMIRGCPRLADWWAERLFCLTSLQILTIGSFSEELEYFPWPSTVSAASASASTSSSVTATTDVDTKYHPNPKQYPFMSLESLTLYGWERVKYLPDQLQHLTTLRDMSLLSFIGLEALPEWLGNLSSLHSLNIWNCPNLMNLPNMEAMQHHSPIYDL
ncbi:hypothetical protein HYC85_019824 [Camellia sinensis]|uniref:Rx N-terminal domain-containing protein n=1 Tax=Camellia sinensis TaxID=4442 RepID=A0A7J7GN20_CAMSI|nr:hypothetical protein HYC85_019824 [Camellia sinensis]